MNVQISRFDDALAYEAPLHFDVKALRLLSPTKAPTSCMAGLSYYLPGGRAEMDASPFEKSYIVLEGEIEVIDGSGEAIVLKPFDSCHIAPCEQRAVHNRTNKVATMLVIIPHKS